MMLVLKDILALALALEGTSLGEREITYVFTCFLQYGSLLFIYQHSDEKHSFS